MTQRVFTELDRTCPDCGVTSTMIVVSSFHTFEGIWWISWTCPNCKKNHGAEKDDAARA